MDRNAIGSVILTILCKILDEAPYAAQLRTAPYSEESNIRAQDRTVCEKVDGFCAEGIDKCTEFARRAATTMVCNIIACIDPLAIQHQNEKTGKCYHPYTSLPGSLYHTVKQNGKTLKNWAHILARLGPRCRLQMKGLLGVGSHTYPGGGLAVGRRGPQEKGMLRHMQRARVATIYAS